LSGSISTRLDGAQNRACRDSALVRRGIVVMDGPSWARPARARLDRQAVEVLARHPDDAPDLEGRQSAALDQASDGALVD
jgi:hypothetical protein